MSTSEISASGSGSGDCNSESDTTLSTTRDRGTFPACASHSPGCVESNGTDDSAMIVTSNIMTDVSNNCESKYDSEKCRAIFDSVNEADDLFGELQGSHCTSNWNQSYNDDVVRRHFKVVRKELTTREILIEFFHLNNKNVFKKWLDNPEVSVILENFRKFTEGIDDCEVEVFFKGATDDITRSRVDLAEEIVDCGYSLLGTVDGITHQGKIQTKRVSRMMTGNIAPFLIALSNLVKQEPLEVTETEYIEVFRLLVTCFGLMCMDGGVEKLKIPETENPELPCKPDLLLASLLPCPFHWVPVEAKAMIADPTFKALQRSSCKAEKGIIKKRSHKSRGGDLGETSEAAAIVESVIVLDESSEDNETPSKRRRVSFSEPSSSECELDKLCEPTRKTVSVFFSELLGQVVALDSKYPTTNNQRFAVGLVGLRVVFLAFYAKPGVRFDEIPSTKGAQTLVHLTRPLSILRAKDREEIALALLSLGLIKYPYRPSVFRSVQ